MSVAYKLDFPDRLYNSDMGRFTQKDPIGFAGGDPNFYNYVGSSPQMFVDPEGLDWVYRQSNGNIGREDYNLNMSYDVGSGYSGAPGHVNNPDSQNLPNLGPLPRGEYTIGPQQDNRTSDGRILKKSMKLVPNDSNEMFNRLGFLIHGDNRRGDQSASQGCPIVNKEIRDQIGDSNDHILRVTR